MSSSDSVPSSSSSCGGFPAFLLARRRLLVAAMKRARRRCRPPGRRLIQRPGPSSSAAGACRRSPLVCISRRRLGGALRVIRAQQQRLTSVKLGNCATPRVCAPAHRFLSCAAAGLCALLSFERCSLGASMSTYEISWNCFGCTRAMRRQQPRRASLRRFLSCAKLGELAA